jgi:hypothetical protein
MTRLGAVSRTSSPTASNKHQPHDGFRLALGLSDQMDPRQTCRRKIHLRRICPRIQRTFVQPKRRAIPPSHQANTHASWEDCEEAGPEAKIAAAYMVKGTMRVSGTESKRNKRRVAGTLEGTREGSYFEEEIWSFSRSRRRNSRSRERKRSRIIGFISCLWQIRFEPILEDT